MVMFSAPPILYDAYPGLLDSNEPDSLETRYRCLSLGAVVPQSQADKNFHTLTLNLHSYASKITSQWSVTASSDFIEGILEVMATLKGRAVKMLKASPNFPLPVLVFAKTFYVIENPNSFMEGTFKKVFKATEFTLRGGKLSLRPATKAVYLSKYPSISFSPQARQIKEAFSNNANILRIEKTGLIVAKERAECLPVAISSYCVGGDLADFDFHTSPNPVFAMFGVFMSPLESLASAHKRNIIHRDIKPENILVSLREDHLVEGKLNDFDTLSLEKEGPHKVSGTCSYFEPAQFMFSQNGLLNQKSHVGIQDKGGDLFALGLTIERTLIRYFETAVLQMDLPEIRATFRELLTSRYKLCKIKECKPFSQNMLLKLSQKYPTRAQFLIMGSANPTEVVLILGELNVRRQLLLDMVNHFEGIFTPLEVKALQFLVNCSFEMQSEDRINRPSAHFFASHMRSFLINHTSELHPTQKENRIATRRNLFYEISKSAN